MESYDCMHLSPVAGELFIRASRDSYTGEGHMYLHYKDGAHDIKRVRYFNGYPDALGPSFWFSNFTALLTEIAEEYAVGWGAKDVKRYSDAFVKNWLQVIELSDFDDTHWLEGK